MVIPFTALPTKPSSFVAPDHNLVPEVLSELGAQHLRLRPSSPPEMSHGMSGHPFAPQYDERGDGYDNLGPNSRPARGFQGQRDGPAGREAGRVNATLRFGANHNCGQGFSQQLFCQPKQDRQAYEHAVVKANFGSTVVHDASRSTAIQGMGPFPLERPPGVRASTSPFPHQRPTSYYEQAPDSPLKNSFPQCPSSLTSPFPYHHLTVEQDTQVMGCNEGYQHYDQAPYHRVPTSVNAAGPPHPERRTRDFPGYGPTEADQQASLLGQRYSSQHTIGSTSDAWQQQQYRVLPGGGPPRFQQRIGVEPGHSFAEDVTGAHYNLSTNETMTGSRSLENQAYVQPALNAMYTVAPGFHAYHDEHATHISQVDETWSQWNLRSDPGYTRPQAIASAESLGDQWSGHRSNHGQECSDPSPEISCVDLTLSESTARPDQRLDTAFGTISSMPTPQILIDSPVYGAHRGSNPDAQPEHSMSTRDESRSPCSEQPPPSSKTTSPGSGPIQSPEDPIEVVLCLVDGCRVQFAGKYAKGNCARHRRQFHGVGRKVIECEEPECGRVFKRKDARLKHYRKHHSHRADTAVKRGVQAATSFDSLSHVLDGVSGWDSGASGQMIPRELPSDDEGY